MARKGRQTMTDNERVILSKEEAIGMLPDGKLVHTFRNAVGAIIGADWDKKDIIDSIQNFEVELSGSMATGMGHGMVLVDDVGMLFIETKKEETDDN